MRVSRTKTLWMECRFEQAEKIELQTVKISRQELRKAVNNFSHSRTVVAENGRMHMEMIHVR